MPSTIFFPDTTGIETNDNFSHWRCMARHELNHELLIVPYTCLFYSVLVDWGTMLALLYLRTCIAVTESTQNT